MDWDENSKKILVIDHNYQSRSILRKKLQTIHHNVIMAENHIEGLQLGEITQPDLILIDAKVKDTGGVAVCEQLKKRLITQAIPIIFLVQEEDIDEISLGFEIGAADFIVTPFPLQELQLRIRMAVHLNTNTVSV